MIMPIHGSTFDHIIIHIFVLSFEEQAWSQWVCQWIKHCKTHLVCIQTVIPLWAPEKTCKLTQMHTDTCTLTIVVIWNCSLMSLSFPSIDNSFFSHYPLFVFLFTTGDVVGFLLDLEGQEMVFTLNGFPLTAERDVFKVAK